MNGLLICIDSKAGPNSLHNVSLIWLYPVGRDPDPGFSTDLILDLEPFQKLVVPYHLKNKEGP